MWTSSELQVVSTREIPPDPAIAKALGQHHSIESAVADLIDNSIDAGATHVVVRFLQHEGKAVGLQIIDNGKGMSSEGLDKAMVLAGQREYDDGDLGHFGVGLKAASLSQASALIVCSRDPSGHAVARKIQSQSPTTLEVLNDIDALNIFVLTPTAFETLPGTIIEWVAPTRFLSHGSLSQHASWLETTVQSLLTHLGLVFHRILERKSIAIQLDVYDLDTAQVGTARRVMPLNPFGYESHIIDGYPAVLNLNIDGAHAAVKAHIWPPNERHRSGFRLGQTSGSPSQGFYFYRADRLLQAGGSWNTLASVHADLELARVEIDITEPLKRHVTINPEKSGIEIDADLKAAIKAASASGSPNGFDDFMSIASGTYRNTRKRQKKPVTLVQPDRGFNRTMLSAFESTVEYSQGNDPVNIRWKWMAADSSPIRLDLDERTIYINSKYRAALSGSDSRSDHDAAFIKALLLIAFSQYFEGQRWGDRDKREVEAWEQLLAAAALEQFSTEDEEGVTP